MKDWCHTNNILQVHCWGCLVVQVMFHALMTSLMTSQDHKVGQILKLIYLRQYLSYSVCDSGKYRGISLSSCITKIIDWVILLKYPHCFRTSELQFAYTKHHATPMCTLALKEVVKYYTSRRGSVYCCLLDATKAFDRVKFDKFFEIMIARNIPPCAIRLVFDMYNRQKVRTVWNGQYSSSFSTSNGVRQGGVLSPILFTLYIDVLLERLESSGVGCHIGHEYLGSLCSADDLALLAPTVFSLRRMLKICGEFSVE